MNPKGKETCAKPDAVFFDFDGVISDTEPLHWRAFRDVLKPLGLALSWRTYLERYLGFDDRGVLRALFADRGATLSPQRMRRLLAEKANAFEHLARTAAVRPYPGVVPLIRSMRRARIRLALCTGALRRDIRPLLHRFGLARAFHVIVTADDVRESKPSPRAYRLAVRRLKAVFPKDAIRTNRCVAIEDTPAGIAAAKGAGLRVLAVGHTYSLAQLRDATAVVKNLKAVTAGNIACRVLQVAKNKRRVISS